MKKILAFNWKANPSSNKDAKKIASFVNALVDKNNKEIIVVPPFLYMDIVLKNIKKSNIKLGAQDVSQYGNGSFTGEISASMLKKFGVSYVIVGHSERRYLVGEKDALIAKKVFISQDSGLIPILCVGEKNRSSISRTKKFVIRQLFADINFSSNKKIIISYEPVWAIGGNKKVNPEKASEVIEEIKTVLKRRMGKNIIVLYGGSINCKNINEFLKYKLIDGFLIGSASLKEKEVDCIIKTILKKKK